VASVLGNTRMDAKLIVLDNDSTDGTWEWLQEFNSQSEHNNIEHFHSIVNLGIAGGMNWFHKKYSDAEYMAKVDDDTLVPDGWLGDLLACMDRRNLDLVGSIHVSAINSPRPAMAKAMERGYAPFKSPGGSGILYKRSFVEGHEIAAKAGDMKSGWTEHCWAMVGQGAKAGFCGDVAITLMESEKGKIKKLVPNVREREAGITPVMDAPKGMRVLLYVHTGQYLGSDGSKPVQVSAGETCMVSEEAARRMLGDFPAWFRDVTGKTIEETTPDPSRAVVRKRSEVKATVYDRRAKKGAE
jgi:hypothetical protein